MTPTGLELDPIPPGEPEKDPAAPSHPGDGMRSS